MTKHLSSSVNVPKIFVIGKNGQVGWELQRSLSMLGDVIALSRYEADLQAPQALLERIRMERPDVIVNAAAYTAVDKAEVDEVAATQINGVAVGELAQAARDAGALFIHYSTDYVFDGSKNGPYVESDEPNPQNAYGRSKLAGERAIQQAGGDWLVLRTTWVYAARGHNFMKTMLRLARERDELRVVGDQYGVPTWARMIAEATAIIVARAMQARTRGEFASGIYHLSAGGATTWHSFAELIVGYARQHERSGSIKASVVTPILTADYPLPACRPVNSILSCEKLRCDYGIVMPAWDVAAELCLADLLECNG
ncbi:MAG: dTDP-4-dehydrorhamnose reductase [Gallionellales bacterium GWA2_59_43]|nr:MAG: dTDP-4-dehydrorhamnose reductase [Gallionellales bacterium GWA2_59_43]